MLEQAPPASGIITSNNVQLLGGRFLQKFVSYFTNSFGGM